MLLQFWFLDAKTETIDQIPAKFFEVLRTALADFDLARMRAVIRRHRRKVTEDPAEEKESQWCQTPV